MSPDLNIKITDLRVGRRNPKVEDTTSVLAEAPDTTVKRLLLVLHLCFFQWSKVHCDLISMSQPKIVGASFDGSCNSQQLMDDTNQIHSIIARSENPLSFMKSKIVLLVSHELSLSGGPLLLMELAFLLRGVGTEVVWITNQKLNEPDEVIYSLEQKMKDRGVQVFVAKGQEAVDITLKADLVILNTAVAGKWLDAVQKENVLRVLPKVLWWIHEMRGHYFKLEYVKHLPFVAGAMIDSHITAEYWNNRTSERIGYAVASKSTIYCGVLFFIL
ncbi:UDP-Glycosyltransferase superfamily protein [Abeliophyllum distichum]|uniref:UDP-Glycosyltransferase superfamily protein n=1 Tax=Abeliophyllum distichum TaxID=126358 RepID=A0ABD1V4D3_9LAMI